jgi:hypothetical protein
VETVVAGIGGAAIAAIVTLVGALSGGRRQDINDLWKENRSLREELKLERIDRQAAEDRWSTAVDELRTEVAEERVRCDERLAELEDAYRAS